MFPIQQVHVKLPSFSGAGSLDTFLVKFENMSRYVHRDEADKINHVCAGMQNPGLPWRVFCHSWAPGRTFQS